MKSSRATQKIVLLSCQIGVGELEIEHGRGEIGRIDVSEGVPCLSRRIGDVILDETEDTQEEEQDADGACRVEKRPHGALEGHAVDAEDQKDEVGEDGVTVEEKAQYGDAAEEQIAKERGSRKAVLREELEHNGHPCENAKDVAEEDRVRPQEDACRRGDEERPHEHEDIRGIEQPLPQFRCAVLRHPLLPRQSVFSVSKALTITSSMS